MMSRKAILKILNAHKICNWFEKFEFTDCKEQIIKELLDLSRKGK